MKIQLQKSHRFGCVCRRCRKYRIGGFLDAFSDKKTSTTNTTQIDNSITDKSITRGVSDNGTLLEAGARQNINITDSSPDVLDLAGKLVESNANTLTQVLTSQGLTLTNALNSVTTNAANLNNNATSGFNSALGKFAELKESELTGGDSSRNKIVLYVVLAVISVFGLLLWRRRW